MPFSRREFLEGAIAAGAVLLPTAGCGNNVQAAPFVDLSYGATGTLSLEMGSFPDLIPVGGAITIRLHSESGTPLACAPAQLLLIHVADAGAPQYVATNSICPHAGCPLGFSAPSQLIECPCHSSRWNLEGKLVHRPARANLTVYPVMVSSGGQRLTIALGEGDPLDPPAENGVVTIDVTQPRFAALASAGGSQILKPPGFGDCLMTVRVDAGTAAALTVVCTHLQCAVRFSGRDLECPCHGSRFTLDGAVIRGPAETPLKKYPAVVAGSLIRISQT